MSSSATGPVVRLVAWRWFPHAACFVAALVLRIAWVLWVDRDGFVLNDAMMYNANAVAINEGLGFRPPQGGPSAQWPPAYSTILAGIYWVFGIEPLWGELFNAIVGAVTVVLLMLLIERVVDRRAAILGGIMLAVLPGPILWTDVLVTETLYTAMFVLCLLVLSYASPTWPWLVAIGAVIGLGALVRGEALTWGLLPIVLFWRDLPWIELVKRVAAIAAVVVVCLLPWTIRNVIVMDAFVPVATNASATLWSGHHAGATGGQTYPPEEFYLQFDQEPPLRELQSGAALRREALEYMVTHPVHELRLIPLKLIHLNRGDSYALDWVNDAPDVAPISPINVERIGVVADLGYYGLLTLFLLGAVVLGRPFWGSRMGRVLAASFLTALFLYGFLYYGNYRYRLPYEPLMVLVSATFLTRLWQWRADARAGRAKRDEFEIIQHARRRADTLNTMEPDHLLADRPSWRGVLHSWVFFAAIPAGVLLIVFAVGAAGRTAAAIYAGTLLAVFGTSAAYHRLAQSYRARQIMQRVDHSMIYLLIAGTYVPICLVGLPRRWGIPLLAVVVVIGLVGMVIKLLPVRRLQWLGYALYPTMGWIAVAATPALTTHLTPLQLGLVVAGGLAYTIGFPVLLLKRPDPWPRSFGYHEVWHGFTVVAAILHFGAVASVVA